MKNRPEKLKWLLCLALCTATAFFAEGCGGYYIMTIPDQVADSGGEIIPIARLQRNDFFVLSIAVEGAPLRFKLKDFGMERASYTDAMGYAGVSLKVPGHGGKYWLEVNLQDFEGDEVARQAPVFVYDSTFPVIVVELEALPLRGSPESESASAALRKLATAANIIYLTRDIKANQNAQHDRFDSENYPDGPVLLWQKQMWHIVREGKYKLPRIVIESRLESQLPDLNKMFPKMHYGICRTPLAQKAFEAASIEPIVVRSNGLFGLGATRGVGWDEFESKGLKALTEQAP